MLDRVGRAPSMIGCADLKRRPASEILRCAPKRPSPSAVRFGEFLLVSFGPEFGSEDLASLVEGRPVMFCITSVGDDRKDDRVAWRRNGSALSLEGLAAAGSMVRAIAFPAELLVGVRRPSDRLAWLAGARRCVAAEHLRCVEKALAWANEAERSDFAEASRRILSWCLAETKTERPQAADGDARKLVEQIIEENLGSARLDVRRICDLTGMPRTTLYRLFDGEGGVAGHVRRRRLDCVYADLQDPALADMPVSLIAARHGLFNASSFTRSFRRRFGRTPGSVRACSQ